MIALIKIVYIVLVLITTHGQCKVIHRVLRFLLPKLEGCSTTNAVTSTNFLDNFLTKIDS